MAGRDLGIDYVIDGIRRVGNRIRVTAQLLSVSEGVTRWAEQFDEESTDVLQIEDSISEKVASALLPQLTGDEKRQLSKRGTDSSEAFEAYLRGRYYWNSYTEVGLAKALECYKKAIKADLITRSPTPALPITTTGSASSVFVRSPRLQPLRNRMRRKQWSSIRLPPKLTARSASRPFVMTSTGPSPKASIASLEINPNYATGHHWYAFHLMMEGRFDEGIDQMLRTRELDPLRQACSRHSAGVTTRRVALMRRSRLFRTCSRRFRSFRMAWSPFPGR